MRIAAYVDADEHLIDFYRKGTISLYEEENGEWQKKKEIPLDMNGIATFAGVRGTLHNAVAQLGECRVFLVRDLKGLHRALLDEMGFHTWQSQGSLSEQLTCVAQKERESADRPAVSSCSCGSERESGGYSSSCASFVMPQPVSVGNSSDGFYEIDLAEILSTTPEVNSKQILIPFMESTPFKRLEIICDHMPKWLFQKLDELNLQADSEFLDNTGRKIKLSVTPC